MDNNSDALHVGVLGGTRIPGNVETFLRNVGNLLHSHSFDFNLDLLIRDASSNGIPGFNTVDPGIDDTERALGTVRTLTAATTQYAKNNPVDVLFQVTKFPIHGFAATVAGRRTNTPVITRFAGDNFREYLFSTGVSGRIRTFALNNIVGLVPARFSDTTVVLGPHGRAEIERRNGNGAIREIPQPVDFNRFSPVSDQKQAALREELGMEGHERVLLTVGRLSKRKGVHDLATAARRLAARDANIRWYVIGDGPLWETLADIELVELVGRVPHDQISDYYRAADLLVHTSLIEGLPNVLLEAAACHTPSISRKVGDAKTVASVTYEDPEQLPDLVLRDYERVELGEQFIPEQLRQAYAQLLMDVAASD